MNEPIEFFVRHELVAKQGDRVRVAKSKSGKSFAMHYRSPKVKRNADAIASLISGFAPARPLEGPLRLDVVVTYPWRAGDSKRARAAGVAWKSTRPDADNLLKNLNDVLQASHFIADDAQFADVRIRKQHGDEPGLAVRIEPVGNKTRPTQEAP